MARQADLGRRNSETKSTNVYRVEILKKEVYQRGDLHPQQLLGHRGGGEVERWGWGGQGMEGCQAKPGTGTQ